MPLASNRSLVLTGILLIFPAPLVAQKETPRPKAAKAQSLSITIEGEVDDELAPVAGQLTKLFYESYPKLLKRFETAEKPAPRALRAVFVNGLGVPAQCAGNRIDVSTEWLRKNPGDVALLPHELTHAVQMYPRGGPGWLTEGIADYARQVYGLKNQPRWSLPGRLTDKQSYKDSYRTTARFLVWLDERTPGAVDKLHRAMQAGQFDVKEFETIAGRLVDALWDECVAELGK